MNSSLEIEKARDTEVPRAIAKSSYSTNFRSGASHELGRIVLINSYCLTIAVEYLFGIAFLS